MIELRDDFPEFFIPSSKYNFVHLCRHKVENKKHTLLAGSSILFVLIVYVWFISLGPWRSRGHTSDYYSQLASAFLHGQLALEQKPDPALLALPNPYDHKARKNVPVLGDASLYKGKYYLYFGPLPGLALAVVYTLLPVKTGDEYFLYLFLFGLFLVQCLLFRQILRRFFSGLPRWILPLGILILGLTGPYLKMLTHPFIHEAAIAGGQLLFTAGFYAAFLALQDEAIHKGKLFLAGLLWAFSIATRSTQLVPVGVLTALTCLYIFLRCQKANHKREFGRLFVTLTGPLAVCGLFLAWYNWARFDSVFEFGLYYQLAAFNLQANYSILFSRMYLLQNLYNYFLNPFGMNSNFPFVQPLAGTEKPVLASFELPNLYAVEGKFPGALFSTPFLLFAILPPLVFVITFIKKLRNRESRGDLFSFFDWTVLGLLAASIAGAMPTLLLFYVGFRYETEFIASLTLLALIGFCQGYQLLRNASAQRIYLIAGAALGLLSVFLNLALAYNGVWT